LSTGYFVGVVRDDGSKMDFDFPQEYRSFVRTLAGYEVEIEIRKRRSKRSIRQNSWMHAFLGPLAAHWGYTVDELKLVGLSAVFGTKQLQGFVVPEKPHTSGLNTLEMADLCEWFIQKAAEDDFLILYPEEFKKLKHKKVA
jgi:hypothetical protein